MRRSRRNGQCVRVTSTLLRSTGSSQNLAESSGDEALAPELDAIAAGRPLDTDAVRHRDVATVVHRMTALSHFPSAVVEAAVFLLLLRMPAYCGGIKQNLCP